MKRFSQSRSCHRFKRKRSGAALYTLVVFNAFLLGMLGLSALAVSRIERSQNQSGIDVRQAKRLATSGIRLAKLQIDQDTNWRTFFQHGALTTSQAVGNGTIRFMLEDLVDADLSNNAVDTVAITAIGEYGDSIWSEQVQVEPIQGPPEFLKMCLHAGESIQVQSSARVVVLNGPLSTNEDVQLNGQVNGDILCRNLSGNGLHYGNTETGQSPKALPLDTVFTDYQAIATALNYTGPLNGVVLSPGVNSYGGGTNTAGIYYINPGNNTLVLEGLRLNGTLLVDGDVSIENAAYMQSSQQQYPVLIVNGNVSISLNSTGTLLREDLFNTNFNPVGAEYQGFSDADELDSYPNQIEGLVHIRGSLTTSVAPTFQGCVLCEGSALLGGRVDIQHDATLYSHPPLGYEELPGPKVKLTPGTWTRVAAPN